MIYDQSLEGTRAYVKAGRAKWLETGREDLMAAWVKEVQFMARQGGICKPPRVLAIVKTNPYYWEWKFEESDRGRYAEV